jgi:Flp pilus assembly protein TadD
VAAESPGFLPGYMVIGMAHEREGNRGAANAAYRKALAVRPDFAPAANNLAWNLAAEEGALDEAYALARIAKGGMPDDAYVADTMGWVYHLLGHHWKAVAELEQAVSLHPHNPVFNYHLGAVYLEAGEPLKAKTFLKRALRSETSFPGSEEARRLIESLEKRTARAM